MYRIMTPSTEAEMEAYFAFRWQVLKEPFHFPKGAEKDEYETVAEHRMLVDGKGDIAAVGRVHLNVQDEAQVRHIAVSPKHRNKGLGSMMVSALEDVAIKQGAKRAVTNSLDTSVEFFTTCGYIVEDAPEELGKLKRQHMVKKLDHASAVLLHPKWCNELQTTWHETIPISAHMGIELYQYSGKTLEARASLNKNINLHGTMFAGSIYSLATLTGWGMIFLQLKERELTGEIVLGDGKIHYHKPVTTQPRAIANIEGVEGNFDYLRKGKKCRLELQVNVKDGDIAVAEFYGVYWVLPPAK